ncbi:hypothetical protein VPH35_022066 [Triticum aestivum]
MWVCVKVVPHYPEDFFALFDFQHQRDKVTVAGRFRHNSLNIHAANWRLDAHSDVVHADYHVHLCIEGIPLSAWCDSVVAQVLGPDTFVHYFDIATLHREDTSSFMLWAWSANPSAILKVLQVTIAPHVLPGVGGAPSMAVGHSGFWRRAIVHLDRVEDYTPDVAGNIPRRPHTDPFTWCYGVVDGKYRVHDRQKPPPRRCNDEDRHRRDDDQDMDGQRGRDNDRSRSSWCDRLFRSHSRAPVCRADDDRHGSRREEHCGDRGRDDRRRAEGSSWDRLAGARKMVRGCSLPPSSRTTSSDIIEITPVSSALGWLYGTASRVSKVQPLLTMNNIRSTLVQASPSMPVTALAFLTPPGLDSEPDDAPEVALTPTTEFVLDTPTPPILVETTPPLGGCTALSEEEGGTPLFIPRMPALLPTLLARSTPPRPPKTRCKTLAGVTGFLLSCHSPPLRAKKRSMPIAKLVEQLMCHRLGIVDEGEQVTEEAIDKFTMMFQGLLPDITVAALRALFKMDCDLSAAVEESLIQYGGEGGPDLSAPIVEEA